MDRVGEFQYDGETLVVKRSTYQGGGTAVVAESKLGEPWATLSVKMPDVPVLPAGTFYLKEWSENERIAQAFKASGLIEQADDVELARSGFVTAQAWRFVS